MLTENTQNQLNLLNTKLQTDLTGVQLRVWELLSNETLTSYSSNRDQAEDVTSEIRIEGEVRKILTENVTSSSVIGTLDSYWLADSKKISSGSSELSADLEVLPFLQERPYTGGWRLIEGQGLYFMDMAPFVSGIGRRQNFDFLIISKVKKDYLYGVLNAFKDNEYVNLMLLSKDGDNYYSGEENKEVLKAVHEVSLIGNVYNYEFRSDSGKYEIIMQRNPLSGIWVVSYFDMNKALQQYRQVNDLTTIVLIFLLILAVLISIYFYRRFYTNLELMVRNFKTVQNGDYSVRVLRNSDRPEEFEFMFKQFNRMLMNTEELIEQLKTEVNLRENAEFRQLQSQINPHFLYNNLLFIMSMAKTSPEAVISMTEHLSAYYRYMTKQYAIEVNLEQECSLAEHYLIIVSLRKDIHYQVYLPNDLKKQPFMTLILQPLVENAIQHGIEQKRGANQVQLIIEKAIDGYFVRVSDDGRGLTLEEKRRMEHSLRQAEPKNQGSIGLWNVNHRLINRYGAKSKLQFSDNEIGGLTVYFFIPDGGLNNEGFIG